MVQGPKAFGHLLLFSEAASREPDQKWKQPKLEAVSVGRGLGCHCTDLINTAGQKENLLCMSTVSRTEFKYFWLIFILTVILLLLSQIGRKKCFSFVAIGFVLPPIIHYLGILFLNSYHHYTFVSFDFGIVCFIYE